MVAAYTLALDSIIGLIEEGVTVIDNGVVEIDYLDGFAR